MEGNQPKAENGSVTHYYNSIELPINPLISQEKKSQLESLSKEELIVKCKNLLVIAKKAKAAKDGRYITNKL